MITLVNIKDNKKFSFQCSHELVKKTIGNFECDLGPVLVAYSGQYYIEVTLTTRATNINPHLIVSGKSGTFTISPQNSVRSVNIISPHSGSTFFVGQPIKISWSTTNVPDNAPICLSLFDPEFRDFSRQGYCGIGTVLNFSKNFTWTPTEPMYDSKYGNYERLLQINYGLIGDETTSISIPVIIKGILSK